MIVVTVFLSIFEPNGLPFGSKSKGKLSPRSYPIQLEGKWKYSFLSVKGLRGPQLGSSDVERRWSAGQRMFFFQSGYLLELIVKKTSWRIF